MSLGCALVLTVADQSLPRLGTCCLLLARCRPTTRPCFAPPPLSTRPAAITSYTVIAWAEENDEIISRIEVAGMGTELPDTNQVGG